MRLTDRKSRNWVFLGDSLTEGIGSQRISHVTELVKQLRKDQRQNGHSRSTHQIRLRSINPDSFDRFVKFNVAGFIDPDQQQHSTELWIWNLGCEGRTIDTDPYWLSFLTNLRPELVVVFRGSLESIVRPAMIEDGTWPWWIPRSWRNYSTLDPRCYFSSTWWRKTEQVLIDQLKEKTRQKLLNSRPGKPLMDLDALINHFTTLLKSLQSLDTRVLVLGLLPVDGIRFPGSPENFERVNQRIEKVTTDLGLQFLDWGRDLNSPNVFQDWFYKDGFHPNPEGSKALANILLRNLKELAIDV